MILRAVGGKKEKKKEEVEEEEDAAGMDLLAVKASRSKIRLNWPSSPRLLFLHGQEIKAAPTTPRHGGTSVTWQT